LEVDLTVLTDIPKNIHLPEYSLIELSNNLKINTILSDDLTFRKYVITLKKIPVGTIGILIKAYTNKLLSKEDLKFVIKKLFDNSSLFLSDIFKDYILKKIDNI
jgi:predicted nucleic acid-binding protein